MGERLLQLQTTAADILQVLSEQAECRVILNADSSFFYFLAVDKYLACEDQGLGSLARGSEPAFDQ